MLVRDLLKQVRIIINDVDGIEFSNEELLSYLNDVQTFFVLTCANFNVPIFMKTTNLQNCSQGALLPEDFLKEHAVFKEGIALSSLPQGAPLKSGYYYILGNKLFSSDDNVLLIYYALPNSYRSIDDELVLPNYSLPVIKNMIAFLAKKRIEIPGQAEVELTKSFSDLIVKLLASISNDYSMRPVAWRV